MNLLRRHLMKLITQGGAIATLVTPVAAKAAGGKEQPPRQTENDAAHLSGSKPVHLLHGAGLHHINVRVRDMDRAIRFYTDAFGFRLVFRWNGVEAVKEGGVYFRNPLRGAQLDMGDGQILELIPAPENAIPPDDRASSFNHMGLRVSDLEETYARALAAGAKPYPIKDGSGGVWDGPTPITLKAEPPFHRSFIVRAAHVQGPDDEIIELFEA